MGVEGLIGLVESSFISIDRLLIPVDCTQSPADRRREGDNEEVDAGGSDDNIG